MRQFVKSVRLLALSLLLLCAAGFAPAWAQEVRSRIGTQEIEAGYTFRFLPTTASGAYSTEAGEQVTVFRPTMGKVAALNLEELALASDALFEVYAGVWSSGSTATPIFTNTDAVPILLCGKADVDAGALTVRFDAKGIAHSGLIGWRGEVYVAEPETSRIMRYNLLDVKPQTSFQGDLSPWFRFQIVQTGSSAPKLEELTFTLKRADYTLREVKLFAGETYDPAASAIATATIAEKELKFTLADGPELTQGYSNFYVIATLESAPALAKEIIIRPSGLKAGGKSLAQRLLPTAVTTQVDHTVVLARSSQVVALSEEVPFLPDLDENGKYKTGNDDLKLLLTPRIGEVAKIAFSDFELKDDALFSVYYGNEALPDMLAVEYTKDTPKADATANPILGLTTKGEGKLLVVFNPKGSNDSWSKTIGWKATVSSAPAEAWKIAGIASKAYDEKPTELFPRAKGAFFTYTLSVEGNENQQSLEAIKLKLDGAESIEKLELYKGKVTKKWSGEWDFSKATLLHTASNPIAEELEATFTAPFVPDNEELLTLFFTLKDEFVEELDAKPFGATLLSYTLGGNEQSYAGTSPASPYTLRKALYMKSGDNHMQLTSPWLLFDDGGPYANPTEGFGGTLVVAPEAGKVTVADFTHIQMVDGNPDPASNDVLEVYAGREKNPDALIWRYDVKTGNVLMKKTVYSTADDGSLTIYFKSVKATTEGFRCELRSEPLKTMEISSLSFDNSTESNLKAALRGKLCQLVVTTIGTSEPVKPTALKFTIPNASGLLDKVSFYHYNPATEGEVLLGETVEPITADEIEVPWSNASTLQTGEQYITIYLTLKPTVKSGTKIKPTNAQFKLANGQLAPADAADAPKEEEVNNTYELEHEEGAPSATLKVGADWVVKHSQYSWMDKGGMLVLEPFSPDHSVEVELFGEFGLGQNGPSKFYIYSGAGNGGAELLAIQEKTSGLPAQTRYTPEGTDNALTIFFDPNGQGGKGFSMRVREFDANAPMELVSAQATTATTQGIYTTEKPASLLLLTLKTKDEKNPLTLDALKLALKGHESLENVAIYRAFGDKSADSLVVKVDNPEAEVTPNPATAEQLVRGDNHYWVVVSLKADAVSGAVFDAAVKEVTLSSNPRTLTAEEGDPAGERTYEEIYLFAGDVEKQVGGTPITFTDDGGPDAKYTADHKGLTKFVPQNADEVVVLEILEAAVAYNAPLTIYHGQEVIEEKQALQIKGNYKNVPYTIVSEADDGSLCVNFKPESSPYSESYFGWVMRVYSMKPGSGTLEGAQTEAMPEGNASLLAGSGDAQALQLSFALKGSVNPMTLKKITLNLTEGNSELLKAVRVRTRVQQASFNTAEVIAEAKQIDGNSIAIGLDYLLPNANPYYFWITYDVSPEAKAGDAIALQIAEVIVDDAPITLPADNAISRREVEEGGLKGDYIVGPEAGATYATLTAAVEDLNTRGVRGAVNFLVQDGEYEGALWIKEVRGCSESNRITIKPQRGDEGKVIVFSNSVYERPNQSLGIVHIDSTTHVRLEGLTIRSDKNFGAGISFARGAHHCEVLKCRVELPNTTGGTYDSGRKGIATLAKTSTWGAVNGLLVEGNEIIGCMTAIEIGGSAPTAFVPSDRDHIVRNNTIINPAFKGIYTGTTRNLTIEGNRIVVDKLASENFTAIDQRKVMEGYKLIGNWVSICNQGGKLAVQKDADGIFMKDVQGTADNPALVANNIVSYDWMEVPSSRNSTIAVAIRASEHVIIAHNTIYAGERMVYASTASGLALQTTNLDATISVVNNLFQSYAEGFVLADLKADALPYFRDNALWSVNATGAVKWDGTPTTVAQLKENVDNAQSKPNETAIMEVQAHFLNAPQDLQAFNGDAYACEVAINGLPTDINGTTRGTKPTAGAIEFVAQPAPAFLASYPKLTLCYDEEAHFAVATNREGAVYVKVLGANESAPSDEELKRSPAVMVGSAVSSLVTEGLTPETDYKAHFLFVPLVGDAVRAEVAFTTLKLGESPLQLQPGYPKLTPFSDGLTLTLCAQSNCEVSYLLITPAEIANPDYSKAKKLALTAEREVIKYREELPAETDYLLLYSVYAEGEQPAAWQEQAVKTLPVIDFVASFNRKKGTQVFENLHDGSGAYAIDIASADPWDPSAKIKSWRMNDEQEARIEIGTNALLGESLSGIMLACDGEVELTLEKGGDNAAETITIQPSGMQPWYESLKNRGKIRAINLRKINAGTTVDVIGVGNAKTRLTFESEGVPMISLATGELELKAKYYYGGASPVTFEWHHGTEKLGEGGMLTTDKLSETTMVILTAIDAEGDTVSREVFVFKESETIIVGGFEESTVTSLLNADGYWKGGGDGTNVTIGTGSFAMTNSTTPYSWSGIAVSQQKATTYSGNFATEDTRSAVGSGANGTPTYGVVFDFKPTTIQILNEQGLVVPGIYVTNGAWGMYCVENGTGFGDDKPFEEGDFVTLTITSDKGDKVTYNLVDYTSSNADEHYALDSWQWLDLSSLQKAKSLGFSISSSRNSSYGNLFPSYSIIDELGASKPVKDATLTLTEAVGEIDLLGFTDLLKDKPELVTVTPEGALTSKVDGVTIALEGTKVKVSGWDSEKASASDEITFKLYRKGRTEWVKLKVNYQNTAVAPITLASVEYDSARGSVEVLDADGQLISVNDELKANQEITIKAAANAGYQVLETGYTVTNATRKGSSNVWVVDGQGDVSITVEFVEKQVIYFTVTKLEAIPAEGGEVKLFDADNKEIKVGERVAEEAIVSIKALPSQHFTLAENGLTYEGLDPVGEGRFKVIGEVRVTARFEVERPYELSARFEPSNGGVVEVHDAEKHLLSPGTSKLAFDQLITITAVTYSKISLPVDSIRVEGAAHVKDNVWQVKGNVRIVASYREEPAVDPVEASFLATISLFPNPCAESVVVSGALEPLRYAIYSVTGVKVAEGNITAPRQKVATRQLPAGLYLLRLQAEDGAQRAIRFFKR